MPSWLGPVGELLLEWRGGAQSRTAMAGGIHPLLMDEQITRCALVVLFFRRLSQRPTAEELEQRNILQRE